MTTPRSVRVAIVGAGLGGLALAQGIVDAEGSFVVLECDQSLDAPGRQVRVHCEARLANLATDILPDNVLELFTAAQSRPDARHLYLDERLVVTAVDERPAPEIVLDTLTTREVLSVGLNRQIRFGVEVKALAGRDVRLADGAVLRTDLCVVATGSDGTDEREPSAARPHEVGLVSLYGCVDLNVHPDLVLPDWLHEGFAIASGEGQLKVAIGLYEPDAAFIKLADKHDGVNPRRYVFWNVIAPADTVLAGYAAWGKDSATAARALGESALADWDSWLPEVISRSAPNTMGRLVLRTSTAGADRVARTPLLYIGDAAHQMLPAALSTYATFADVAVLAPALAEAAAAGSSPCVAADVVSDQLRSAGFGWVRTAEQVAAPAFGLQAITG